MKSEESRTLFLIWKANRTGSHIPVGRLDWEGGEVVFSYLAGVHSALEKGMGMIPEFPDLERVYRHRALFPFFQNRLLNRNRPDFTEYVRSLGLDDHDSLVQDLEVLDRSEGRKATDRFRIFRKPANVEGRYSIHCFISGMTRPPVLQHLDEILKTLRAGDVLLPMLDVQNPYDRTAVALKKENGWLVGYLPAYYSTELQPLLLSNSDSISFRVHRVNQPWKSWLPDVVLIAIEGPWPKDWNPFSDGPYAPLREASVAL